MSKPGIFAGLLSLMLVGCSGLEQRGEQAVEKVQDFHDKQLVLGRLAVCGSSIRSIYEEYRNEPDKIMSIMVLCGYSEVVPDLCTFSDACSRL